MSDVSNKTLALLVGVAIVISVAGIMVAQRGVVHVTGMAITGEGEANLTVVEIVEISVTNDIEFGAGYVYANSSHAEMYSNNATICGSVVSGTSACSDASAGITGTGGNWTFTPQMIAIENTGNVLVNLTVNSTETAATMIGGTSPELEYLMQETESGACTSGLISTTYNTLDGSAPLVCANMSTTLSADELNMSVRVKVPDDAPPEVKSTTITFTAEKSTQ